MPLCTIVYYSLAFQFGYFTIGGGIKQPRNSRTVDRPSMHTGTHCSVKYVACVLFCVIVPFYNACQHVHCRVVQPCAIHHSCSVAQLVGFTHTHKGDLGCVHPLFRVPHCPMAVGMCCVFLDAMLHFKSHASPCLLLET